MRLQGPDTVRVLGELLFDERNPWEKTNFTDSGLPLTNALYAVESLHKLGLKNPPVLSEHTAYADDLHTWQLWYQQVKAGNRTFSFKGDDTVYTLAGPVAANDASPPSATSHPNEAVAPVSSLPNRPPLWLILGAALLAVGAAFFALKRMGKAKAG